MMQFTSVAFACRIIEADAEPVISCTIPCSRASAFSRSWAVDPDDASMDFPEAGSHLSKKFIGVLIIHAGELDSQRIEFRQKWEVQLQTGGLLTSFHAKVDNNAPAGDEKPGGT
jgi:hypothetical protein